MWNYLDVCSLGLNIAVVIMVLAQKKIESIRRIEAVAVALMWIKFLYFFRIIDTTAPLVRMIKEIIKDMFSFGIIYIFALLAFANAYWVLARNQAFSDDIDPNTISYFKVIGSIRAVYLSSIGEFDHSTYDGSSDEHYLWIILCITTIFL